MENVKAPERKARRSGMILQIALAVICIALGGALLFVKELNVKIFCNIFCIALIVAGIACIAHFFITGAYRRISEYGFSLGILLVILGVCGFIRAEALSASFGTYTGFLTLLLGVIMIQSTVQLSVMRSGLNIVVFIFSLITLICSVIVIMGIKPILSAIGIFPQLSLLVSGVLSLISFVVTAITLHKNKKPAEEAAPEAAPAAEPSAPAEASAPVYDDYETAFPQDAAPADPGAPAAEMPEAPPQEAPAATAEPADIPEYQPTLAFDNSDQDKPE